MEFEFMIWYSKRLEHFRSHFLSGRNYMKHMSSPQRPLENDFQIVNVLKFSQSDAYNPNKCCIDPANQ